VICCFCKFGTMAVYSREFLDLHKSSGQCPLLQTVKKPTWTTAEGFGKRSVSRLEFAERTLPAQGKGRVSRLSAIFQKADGASPFIPTVPQKRLEGAA
jgi:hypothetical protein